MSALEIYRIKKWTATLYAVVALDASHINFLIKWIVGIEAAQEGQAIEFMFMDQNINDSNFWNSYRQMILDTNTNFVSARTYHLPTKCDATKVKFFL